MDFEKELEAMRANYAKRPLRYEKLPQPKWLTEDDGLYTLYRDKEMLFSCGTVYYAYVVQANIMLFKPFPRCDLPANIIFSVDSAIRKNPMLLQPMARYLFHYKDKSDNNLRDEYKEILRLIRDERDRSSIRFQPFLKQEIGNEMIFSSIMVFRKHLPQGVLKGSLLPILAAPDHSEAVMILPKRYWTKAFKRAWLSEL